LTNPGKYAIIYTERGKENRHNQERKTTMMTIRFNTYNENEWDRYDAIVMHGIDHTEVWEEDGTVVVTLNEEDYRFWFCEEEEE
jgi:hypothetical protein